MIKKQDKKITFCIECLASGGAERVTSVLANSFYDNGFQVDIIILEKSDNEYQINNNIKKHYLTLPQSGNIVLKYIKNLKSLKDLLNKIGSGTVISLAMPALNRYLVLSLLLKKTKLILSERNDPKNFPDTKKLRKIRDLTYKFANIIVFQTNNAKDYFPKKIQKKGVIIPNPIKKDLPQRYNGNRTKEIVSFCRLAPQKNIPMLLNAFELLAKDYPNYTLTIYGRGEQEEELKEYAKGLNCKDQVTFKDYAINIHSKIIDSAMFISSSDYEGISNSMLEALAIGLPSICTDCPPGGARMFIKPYENGLLVPVGDAFALYSAMKELIENQDLSDKLSKNAIKIREELSQDKIFKKWLNLLKF
ncbi:glycosyltransferase [Clostridium estertheticum]|uniref:glycosyltransferase n=1 Tax=Clostridium estertheticum TaxID=238834 RepID=UPI0013E91345|nr:glycosyltransferase [Clostridium estertheticum]MBZ9687779.1 glycosyltransferase [Clostridium estertheticum]